LRNGLWPSIQTAARLRHLRQAWMITVSGVKRDGTHRQGLRNAVLREYPKVRHPELGRNSYRFFAEDFFIALVFSRLSLDFLPHRFLVFWAAIGKIRTRPAELGAAGVMDFIHRILRFAGSGSRPDVYGTGCKRSVRAKV
jgi:hypothetical protein